MCVEQFLQRHVGVVAFDDFGRGLQGAYDLLDTSQFLWGHFGRLVQQDDVAELYLPDDEVLDVFLVQPFSGEAVAAGKLAL